VSRARIARASTRSTSGKGVGSTGHRGGSRNSICRIGHCWLQWRVTRAPSYTVEPGRRTHPRAEAVGVASLGVSQSPAKEEGEVSLPASQPHEHHLLALHRGESNAGGKCIAWPSRSGRGKEGEAFTVQIIRAWGIPAIRAEDRGVGTRWVTNPHLQLLGERSGSLPFRFSLAGPGKVRVVPSGEGIAVRAQIRICRGGEHG